jgi:hypothetical protein
MAASRPITPFGRVTTEVGSGAILLKKAYAGRIAIILLRIIIDRRNQ